MTDLRKLDRGVLLEQALAALRAWGLKAEMRSAEVGPIAEQDLLELSKGTYAQIYTCDTRRKLSAPMAGALITQLKQTAESTTFPVLLVADYIAPKLGERLRAAGQEYIDAASNAWLNSGPFLIFCFGNGPAPKGSLASIVATHGVADVVASSAYLSAASVAARSGVTATRSVTPAGIKLLFALMCQPGLAQATYRELAAAAGVSLGALTQTLEDLQQHGYVALMGRSRRLLASRRLLDDWALMYARTLRPKLLLRTLAAPDATHWQDWSLTEDAALWGGEPAAHLHIGFLRPGVLSVYANKLPGRLLVSQRLKAPEPGQLDRLVEIRRIFWGAALHDGAPGNTVPAVLIYADLLATGDARCIETAQKLYEQELAGFFPAA